MLRRGTNEYAIFSGKVTYIGFSGAGGYTATITNGNMSASYCHVSPEFLVHIGQFVNKGTTIVAKVGPKNVYGVINNPYKDGNGNPTNGATTRSASAPYYKKRRHCRQSFELFLILF